jgi:hypothetical protein
MKEKDLEKPVLIIAILFVIFVAIAVLFRWMNAHLVRM